MAANKSTTTNIGRQVWGYRTVILFMLWFMYFVNCIDRISVLTFLPYIQNDLNLTVVQVSWLGSIFFFGYALAQITAGFFTDKLGAKKTINIAFWIFTLVTFVTGLVKNFTQFIWLRFALAAGEGHQFAPSTRLIANWFPREERNRATGFFATSWVIAPAVVPLLCTWLAADFFGGNWRPVFFVLALPGLFCLFLLWRYVEDSPYAVFSKGWMKEEEYQLITSSDYQSVTTEGEKKYRTIILAKDMRYYFYCISLYVAGSLYWGLTAWISTFLVKQHGLDLKTMGFYASMPYIVAILGTYLGGWMADKLFRGRIRILVTISFVGAIPAFLFLGSVSKGDMNMLIIALVVAGFFANLVPGPLYAFPSLRYPRDLVGRAIGIANCAAQLGGFLTTLIAGYLVITLPDKSLKFDNVFIFFSILCLIGSVAGYLLRETPFDSSKYEIQKQK